MAESDFSWLKIASFFGVLVLFVLAIVVVASGCNQIAAHKTFYGVASILAGLVCVVNAVLIYKNYQEKSMADRYGR